MSLRPFSGFLKIFFLNRSFILVFHIYFWIIFLSWAFTGVDIAASRYEKVFLLFSSGYQHIILLSLALFLLLMVGDFLWGEFLLFDQVALISVHHSHGRMWWAIGLWASGTPIHPPQPETEMPVCLRCPGSSVSFSQERWGEGQLGEIVAVFVSLANGIFTSTATASPVPYPLCHWN